MYREELGVMSDPDFMQWVVLRIHVVSKLEPFDLDRTAHILFFYKQKYY